MIRIVYVLMLVLGFNTLKSQDLTSYKLTEKWKSLKLFKTPESIYYNSKDDILYVSNINGKPIDKDGNGFISVVKPSGEIKKLKWVTGLNAPKGMAMKGSKLYVTDIDRIVVIDIVNGEVEKQIGVKDAQFLNDLEIDSKGNIYISDMLGQQIFIYNGKNVSLWVKHELLDRPNGLEIKGGSLLVGNVNKIVGIKFDTKKLTEHPINKDGIDGLKKVDKQNILISDWVGNIHLVNLRGEAHKLLSTLDNPKVNAADIEYIKEKNMLIVPTFFNNRIVAYSLQSKLNK